MRNPLRSVFVLLALATASEAFAQQSILVSVPGWPQVGNRTDGKFVANAFTWGITAPLTASPGAAGGSAGRVQPQDAVLVLPVGDATLLFTRTAFRSEHIGSVLVEFSLAKGDPNAPAPFAMRLTTAFVTSVTVSKASGDGGPGTAEVKLKATRIELFTSTQAPDGSRRGSQKAGMDFTVMKPM